MRRYGAFEISRGRARCTSRRCPLALRREYPYYDRCTCCRSRGAPDGAPASRGPSWVVSPTWFGSAAQYCCWVLRSAGDSTSPAASTSRLIS
jgi:hypothetical protein